MSDITPMNTLSEKPLQNYSSNSMFPSFSSFGGGDAPLRSNIPRVRNQLFTISTRSVLSAHSQVNVSYTTTSTAELKEEQEKYSPIAAAVNDFNLNKSVEEFEEKPLNIQPLSSLKSNLMEMDDEELERLGAVGGTKCCVKTVNPSPLTRSFSLNPPIPKRCFHGSLENLHGGPSSDGVGSNPGEQAKSRFTRPDNRRKSAPAALPNARSQMIAAANDLLHEENKCLNTKIQKTRKKLFVTKIATCFALEALKRRGRLIKEMEAMIEKKNEQCAARLILHSLLLNCWRNTRRELDMKMDDNNELRKSVENFTLQVQVLRHVSNNEKQKAQVKAKLIDGLNDEVRTLKEENRIMRREVDKMENELNSLQASTQNMTDENNLLKKEVKSIVENRDCLNQSFERERRRSEDFGKENAKMKESLRKVEKQLKEATEQRSHWQEKAMSAESEAWELQLNVEERNNNIKELKGACDALRQDKMDLIEKKGELKRNLDMTVAALKNLSVVNGELTKTYDSVKTEKDLKAIKISELERTLAETRKEYLEIEKELMTFKLQNVRRRREWANALYCFVSPVDTVLRKLT